MKPDQFSLLLVDDNEMNRDMLSRRLHKRGYDVTAVSGGREALSLVQREDFDLVLLDIMMPDIDGIEVLKTLRKQHSLVELPVIMVTAKNHNDDVVNALSLGANDYVQKPLQFEVLLARIEIQLSRRGLEAELKHVAIHDGLTGLYNRWYFDQALEETLHTCDQQQRPLTLLLFDLDGFKQINDQLGHLKGDDVLRQVGKLFAGHLRQSDMVFRYGGDEFIMLIRASNGQSSRVVKRLKQAFDDWLAAYDLEHLTLGLSMGQVCWEPGMNPDPEFLLRKADAQLYQQKRDKQVNKLQSQLSEKSKQVDVQTSFLNGVDEMIVATDLEGRVVYVNQAFAGWCGLSQNRLMDGVLKLALPAFGPIVEQVQQKQFQAHKLEWPGNGRHTSTILVKPSELKQERGTPYGYVFFASDITELETTSERLLQSQQFLERLNNETQLQPLLQLILEEAVDLIPNADSGSAQVVEKATDHFKFVAAVGWPLEVLSGIEIPRAFDIHPDSAQQQPAIIETDLYRQDEQNLGKDLAGQFAELGPPARSALSLPVYLEGELVGKFNIDCKTTKDAFTDADIALLNSLVPQIKLSIRRAREHRNLETANERLLQSQQFLERLNTEMQLQPLLQLILEEAVDLIPNADSGSAQVVEKATDHFKFVAAVGWPLEVLSGIEIPRAFDVHPDSAPQQPAIIESDLYPQIRQNLGKDLAGQFAELGPPPRSVLSLPIYLDGELVGKFYIDCKTTKNAFTDADVALLDSLLPQVELSIRRARERQNLEKTNAYLTRTQHFLERLNNEYRLQPLLQLILEEAVDLIPNADSGSAKLYDERSGYSHFVAAVNWPMEILSTIKLPIERDKFAIHTPDNLNIVKVNMSRFMREAFDEETVQKFRSCGPPALSTLSMPIHVDGQLIGRFNIDNTSREHVFNESDIKLLSSLMPQIELAVRRVKGRQELEEQQSRLQLAFQLGNELAQLDNVQDMAHHAADWAAQRYGYDLVGIGLIEDENILRVYAYSGSEDAKNYVGSSMPLSEPGLVTKAIRTQKAVFVDDVTQVEDYVSVDGRTRSELVVPITLRDERIGALNLESFQKRSFRQEDQELAYFLAGQLAIAIHSLRREEVHKLSEKRYRSLFELAPDGIMLLDEQRRFVNVNPQMCALLGYSKEEFLNLELAQIIAPEERAVSEERIGEVLQGASFEQPYVRQVLCKDGSVLPLEAKTIPILDDQGNPKYVMVMGRDVSKAQQLEQKLKESEQKHRHLIEKTQVGVCISQDGRVVFANKRLEEITGYSREELLKQHRLDIVHPDDHELFKIPLEKRLGRSKQSHYNFRLIHKKGHVVHVEVFGSSTTYQGKPAIIGTLIDMTAQKRAEKRAKKFKRELESSAIQTITMLAKMLEERDAHTAGHCQRLLDYSIMLGKKFKLSKPRIESLKYAALLHDVGKIGVPESILNKKDRLTSSEWEVVKGHVRMSVELIQGIGPLKHTSRIIAQHHEKWNGSGYPSGLKGEDILLEARILAVVDAFDAMTNDRPYRKAMPQDKACRILKEGAGFQWDPVVVDIFLKFLQDA